MRGRLAGALFGAAAGLAVGVGVAQLVPNRAAPKVNRPAERVVAIVPAAAPTPAPVARAQVVDEAVTPARAPAGPVPTAPTAPAVTVREPVNTLLGPPEMPAVPPRKLSVAATPPVADIRPAGAGTALPSVGSRPPATPVVPAPILSPPGLAPAAPPIPNPARAVETPVSPPPLVPATPPMPRPTASPRAVPAAAAEAPRDRSLEEMVREMEAVREQEGRLADLIRAKRKSLDERMGRLGLKGGPATAARDAEAGDEGRGSRRPGGTTPHDGCGEWLEVAKEVLTTLIAGKGGARPAGGPGDRPEAASRGGAGGRPERPPVEDLFGRLERVRNDQVRLDADYRLRRSKLRAEEAALSDSIGRWIAGREGETNALRERLRTAGDASPSKVTPVRVDTPGPDFSNALFPNGK